MKSRGIVITSNDEIRIHEFNESLSGVPYDELSKIVGGTSEHVRPMYLEPPYCLFCNDDGHRLQLPINLAGCFLYGTAQHGAPILGDIVILKDAYIGGEPASVGIPDNAIEALFHSLMKKIPILKGVVS